MVSVKNALLITIDSLRADHLGSYGYTRGTSPALDRLAAEGVRFTQAISPGGATPEAFPAILASRHPPLAHPYATPQIYRGLLRQQPSLAETLQAHGLRTAAFHSNPYLSALYGYEVGFDTFDDGLGVRGSQWRARASEWAKRTLAHRLPRGPLELLAYYMETARAPYTRAELITAKATDWLSAYGNEPFFLWVHYMDVHIPYVPPRDYLSRFHPGISRMDFARMRRRISSAPRDASAIDLRILLDSYDAAIAYTDANIGSLLGAIEASGRLEETAVIMTADHGQEFGEHGRFFHGHVLYEPVVRVPLILHAPGIARSICEQQVALWDIPPTVVDLLGLPPVAEFVGTSLVEGGSRSKATHSGVLSTTLWGDMRRRSVAYRKGGWKLTAILESDVDPELHEQELYDLTADPAERHNRFADASAAAVRDDLLRALNEALAEMRRERAIAEGGPRTPLAARISRARTRTSQAAVRAASSDPLLAPSDDRAEGERGHTSQ